MGSLPVGARLVERMSGWAPREVNPHLLGVENVARLVGGGVALGAFGLDLVKGIGGLTAGVAGGWLAASLAVAGGVAPLPGFAPGGLLGAAAAAQGLVAALASAGLLGVVVGHLAPLRCRASRWRRAGAATRWCWVDWRSIRLQLTPLARRRAGRGVGRRAGLDRLRGPGDGVGTIGFSLAGLVGSWTGAVAWEVPFAAALTAAAVG